MRKVLEKVLYQWWSWHNFSVVSTSARKIITPTFETLGFFIPWSHGHSDCNVNISVNQKNSFQLTSGSKRCNLSLTYIQRQIHFPCRPYPSHFLQSLPLFRMFFLCFACGNLRTLKASYSSLSVVASAHLHSPQVFVVEFLRGCLK